MRPYKTEFIELALEPLPGRHFGPAYLFALTAGTVHPGFFSENSTLKLGIGHSNVVKSLAEG